MPRHDVQSHFSFRLTEQQAGELLTCGDCDLVCRAQYFEDLQQQLLARGLVPRCVTLHDLRTTTSTRLRLSMAWQMQGVGAHERSHLQAFLSSSSVGTRGREGLRQGQANLQVVWVGFQLCTQGCHIVALCRRHAPTQHAHQVRS